ncbi:hypothetical protein [Streptomyces sp. NPDC002676]
MRKPPANIKEKQVIVKKIAARAGLVGAAAVMAMSGLAGQASADSANISSWNTDSSPARCTGSYSFCLYYSPDAEGAMWATSSDAVSNLSGATFHDDGHGSAGAGQGVRNNAASAENADNYAFCNVGIWVYPGFTGNSNWLSPGKGGNLTSWMRNNEASIAIDDSTRCPGVGIG